VPTIIPTVLAVGAAGQFAGLVVPALAKRGARVRAFIQDESKTEAVLSNGASEVALGDLRDAASVGAALKGAHGVFYIAPAFQPDEVQWGQSMVETAKEAGVRRFVFSSVIHPTLVSLENHRAKAPVEDAILSSGMEFTLLHPALFFQNLKQSWPKIIKGGTYSEPWSPERRFTRVDYRDVAEVAAIALTEDRLLNGTFELCAPGDLNRRDVAAQMSEVLGRKIDVGITNPDEIVNGMSIAGNDRQMQGLKKMFAWYDRHDLLGNALILEAILGRAPRTLRSYLGELAAGER